MESLKLISLKIIINLLIVFLFSCKSTNKNIIHTTQEEIKWTNPNYDPYIDFINDSGVYKNHTSIILIYPYGPNATQNCDTSLSKKMATTLVKGTIYERLNNFSLITTNVKSAKKTDTILLQQFWQANESVYLSGNNTIGGNEFLFTANFGHAEPDTLLYDFYYARDTIFIDNYSANSKDIIYTDKIYFPLKKLLSINF